jgi:Tfp pilus assembly protein FimT
MTKPSPEVEGPMIPRYRLPHRTPSSSAFSLLEVLVVITLIAALSVLSLPAIRGLTTTKEFSANAYALADLFEQARLHATAHSTYTWVVIQPITSTGSPPQIVCATFASKDGTAAVGTDGASYDPNSTWLLKTSDSTKLTLVNRPLVLQSTAAPLPGDSDHSKILEVISPPTPQTTPTSLTSGKPSFIVPVAGSFTPGPQQVIQFTPRGEAKVANVVNNWIDVPLNPVLGGGQSDLKNVALVRVHGPSGYTHVYRKN